MIYEFERLSDGEPIEVEFRMAEAPSIGDVVEVHEHGFCRRVVSSGLVMQPVTTIEGFESFALDPDLARDYGHKRFSVNGSPIFTGKKEAEELSERSEGEIHYRQLPTASERARHRRSAKDIARSRSAS